MTDLDAWLRARHDRCSGCGHHVATQGCQCATGEWPTFLAAVSRAADPAGVVSQSRVRPLIRGVIPPKHIGSMYRRAVAENVLEDTGEREPSTDLAGRNADKLQRLYRLGAAA